jgi:hypothetical protein
MTADRDVTGIVRSWLEDGATALPDRVLDRVLDELPATPQRRPLWSAWRSRRMNSVIKLALAAAAVVAVLVAGINFLPRKSDQVGGQGVPSPSPVASPSPGPTASPRAVRLTVAGTELNGPSVQVTAQLPEGWTNTPYAANDSNVGQPLSSAFFLSVIDNTFADPCAHVERNPKVGSSIEAKAAAIGEIPGLTATAPVQTTIAGRAATYVEITVPASLPCTPAQFYLWQDSPDGDWWVLDVNEVIRVWTFDVGGKAVTLAARSFSSTTDASKAELQGILDTLVFETATTQPSTSPAAS